MSKDRTHIVNNQCPKAVVYFIDKDWTLNKKTEPKILAPDLLDILEVNTTRGTLGNGGSFTIVLNNKDNKYFVKDDINKDIENLQYLDNVTPLREVNEQYGKDSYPFQNAKEFLEAGEVTKRYDPNPDSLTDTPEGVDLSFTLDRDNDGKLGYFNIPVNEHTDNDINQKQAATYWTELSDEEAIELDRNKKSNSQFFEEHGGDLEHGRCLFEPMQRVVIQFSRSFIYDDNPEDIGELKTVFTGLVSVVSDSYQENLQTVTIRGEDLTKWLRVTQINMNPSFVTEALPDSGDFLLTQHKFSDMEGWQIIQSLIVGGATATEKDFAGVGSFTAIKTDDPGRSVTAPPKQIKEINVTPIGSPYSAPHLIKDDVLHLQVYQGVTAQKDSGTNITTPYKLFFKNSANTFDNDYSTVWDVAVDVAKLTNFEFYADAEGDLWYHQPRFNNYHILNADKPQHYVIRDEDIISHDFSEADESIITSVFVTGMQDLIEGMEIALDIANFYEDLSFVRKYGRRFLFTHHPYVLTKEDCYYFAKSLMYRINAERFTGQLTITGRSEIDPAWPVYISYRNMIYYIKEVSHSFKFGGQFTTTLQLTYGHKPWELLPEILDYKTTAPHIALSQYQDMVMIEVFPVDNYFSNSATQGTYVMASDYPIQDMAGGQIPVPKGYLIDVVAEESSNVSTDSTDNKSMFSEQTERTGATDVTATPGWQETPVRPTEAIFPTILATIDGRITEMSQKAGYLKIVGTGKDKLFEVLYVGLSGAEFDKFFTKVSSGEAVYNAIYRNTYDKAIQEGMTEVDAVTLSKETAKTQSENAFPPKNLQVRAGDVIGNLGKQTINVPLNTDRKLTAKQESYDTSASWEVYMRLIAPIVKEYGVSFGGTAFYYAVLRNGISVYPNEVHTTKFVDKQGATYIGESQEV